MKEKIRLLLKKLSRLWKRVKSFVAGVDWKNLITTLPGKVWKSVRAERLGLVKLCLLGALCVCLVLICVMNGNLASVRFAGMDEAAAAVTAAEPVEAEQPELPAQTAAPAATQQPTPRQTPSAPQTTATPAFEPAGDSSRIASVSLQLNGEAATVYTPSEKIDFPGADEYSAALTGITTYRGNNFRNCAQSGTAEMQNRRFDDYWLMQTSSLVTADGVRLSGTGAPGQALAVRWPEQTRQHMDMFLWAEETEDLTELIIASQDGHIYFLDALTGNRTRDALDFGISFFGSGTLDPRGYPLLYVGGGTPNAEGTAPCVYVIDLIKGSVLYKFGAEDGFAIHWKSGFDAAPLVDAETDQLIVTGENGVLYLLKLNSSYDAETGKLTVEPSAPVEWKYSAESADAHAYGFTASPVIWRGHLLTADRGGNVLCIDLNTLTVDWCVDGVDCTHATPLLDVEADGHVYLYTAPVLEYGFRAYYQGDVPVRKLDAETGEVVWEQDFACFTDQDESGGVLGGFALGSGDCNGVLFVEIARCGSEHGGVLVALNCKTGKELWRYSGPYSAAAPTFFTDSEGHGYLLHVVCEEGSLCLLDGVSGQLLDQYNFGVRMQSAPIVVDNTVVVGTERYSIFGIELS